MILAVAAWSDVRKGRIPNGLIVCGLAIGGIKHILEGGAPGLFNYVLCFLIAGSVFYLFFITGVMGAGDVKLFAMIFAWLGPDDGISVMALTFMSVFLPALSAVVRGIIEKRSTGQIMRIPLKLAPAALIGWVAYLGGIKIV